VTTFMTQDHIRRAEIRDAEALPHIERSAGQAFRQIPELAWIADDDDLPVERHRELIGRGACWVAVDQLDHPIGFLSAEVLSGDLHIWELSVRLDRQRAGLGGRLVQHAIEDAKSRCLAAVTLTTFRGVAWNEPFYARLGFKTLDKHEVGRRIDEVLRAEIEHGLPEQSRCAMRLPIQ